MKGIPLLATMERRGVVPSYNYKPPRGEGRGVAVKTLKYRR